MVVMVPGKHRRDLWRSLTKITGHRPRESPTTTNGERSSADDEERDKKREQAL